MKVDFLSKFRSLRPVHVIVELAVKKQYIEVYGLLKLRILEFEKTEKLIVCLN